MMGVQAIYHRPVYEGWDCWIERVSSYIITLVIPVEFRVLLDFSLHSQAS